MNCNCIDKTEAKLREHFDKDPTLKGRIESVECLGTGMTLLGNSLVTTINIPFAIKADAPGFRSSKGRVTPFIASFCPFCGVSTKKEAASV